MRTVPGQYSRRPLEQSSGDFFTTGKLPDQPTGLDFLWV